MSLLRRGWTRSGRAAVVLGVLLAAAALHVSGAGAANANMSEAGGKGTIRFQADPGEINNLTVTSCGTDCVHLADSGADIAGGWGFLMGYGCSTDNASSLDGHFGARCIHPAGIDEVDFHLGDMDDRLVLSLPASDMTIVAGDAGNDTLIGGPEIDNLYASTGNDTLVGGGNCDELEGGLGDDTLDGGAGPDMIWGQDGVDTVDYSSRTAPVYVSLDPMVGSAPPCTSSTSGVMFGNDGGASEGDYVDPSAEYVKGGSGDDVLRGNSDANMLFGGAGNDTLDGDDGVDVLAGGTGNDTIKGGYGNDSLFGEAGNDTLYAYDMNLNDTLDCGNGSDSMEADAAWLRPRAPAVYESATGCESQNWIFPLRIA